VATPFGFEGACLFVTADLVGIYVLQASQELFPAKAGVHVKQRCAIWTPAFVGEQLLVEKG
jgi:hypothetical protein